MNRTSAYQALPWPLQEVVVNLEATRIRATRYAGDFDERLQAALEDYERGPSALLKTQAERLERALAHFSRTVPRFRHLSASTIARDPYGVLAELAPTDKTSVRTSPEAFVATSAPGSVEEHRTSGTTGTALRFLSTAAAAREQWAVWWRYRSWFGLQPGTWHGLFGGKPVVPNGADHRYCRVAYPLRQVFDSSLHISDATASAYFEDIDRRGLTRLHGYPYATSPSARWAIETDLGPPPALQAIMGGSERLSALPPYVLEHWFLGRTLKLYGLPEDVANLSACSAGRLSADEGVAAVEFHETEAARYQEIVGTNITNLVQAFVRYRTGDLASDLMRGCVRGRFGRSGPRGDGPFEDAIVTADSRLVGKLGSLFHNTHSAAKTRVFRWAPEQSACASPDSLRRSCVRSWTRSKRSRLCASACTQKPVFVLHRRRHFSPQGKNNSCAVVRNLRPTAPECAARDFAPWWLRPT